jgi:hypothetical protein
MDEPTMHDRARGFKRIFETVQEEYQEDISPEATSEEMLTHVTLITEWIDPMTGNSRLLDHHIGSGGDRMATPWASKGVMLDALEQFDKERGRA